MPVCVFSGCLLVLAFMSDLFQSVGQQTLPVLRLSDFGDAQEPKQAVQTNRSILGDNLL